MGKTYAFSKITQKIPPNDEYKMGSRHSVNFWEGITVNRRGTLSDQNLSFFPSQMLVSLKSSINWSLRARGLSDQNFGIFFNTLGKHKVFKILVTFFTPQGKNKNLFLFWSLRSRALSDQLLDTLNILE
jgi:hypothetical protein